MLVSAARTYPCEFHMSGASSRSTDVQSERKRSEPPGVRAYEECSSQQKSRGASGGGASKQAHSTCVRPVGSSPATGAERTTSLPPAPSRGGGGLELVGSRQMTRPSRNIGSSFSSEWRIAAVESMCAK